MLLFIILFVAIIMAVFALIGLARGLRTALVLLAAMFGGAVFLNLLGARLIGMINLGVRFLRGGGLAAMAGSDPSKALADVFARTAKLKPTIDPNQPTWFYVLIFVIFVLIGFGLSSLPSMRRKGGQSFSGALLGLANGYTIASYLLAVLFPKYALLPTPLPIKGMTTGGGAVALPVAGQVEVSTQFMQSLSQLANSPSLQVVVVVLIVVFIIMATRLTAGKG